MCNIEPVIAKFEKKMLVFVPYRQLFHYGLWKGKFRTTMYIFCDFLKITHKQAIMKHNASQCSVKKQQNPWTKGFLCIRFLKVPATLLPLFSPQRTSLSLCQHYECTKKLKGTLSTLFLDYFLCFPFEENSTVTKIGRQKQN